MFKALRVWVCVCLLTVQNAALFANQNEPSLIDPSTYALSPFRLERPERARSTVLAPLISFFLPSFDQWWEQQHTYGLLYSSGYLGAFSYFVWAMKFKGPHADNHLRFSGQLLTAMGGYSLYHSFRSAAITRQRQGDYAFLKHHETPREILGAPFQFGYLARPTTLIPIFAAVGLGFLGLSAADRQFNFDNYSLANGYFDFGTSYVAGTWEEATFRGWLMPTLRQGLGSDLLSNLITATVFGAAHLRGGGSTFIPWPQFLAGFYFGYIVQQSDWQLGEVIFQHAWYDVILSVASSVQQNRLMLRLPPIVWVF